MERIATVICGTTIGAWAFSAAGAVIRYDVPVYAIMAGVPAKQIGWMCLWGEKHDDNTLSFEFCHRKYVTG
ncbi:hypothetical protein [Salibacterium aidingense]|uniref:hypothetical protein n=1 Tax=Salibacterium aidingense TaxID=384933 RepID=UPI003BDAB6F0